MSILKPSEENVTISPHEIIEIISHDIGVNASQVKLSVKVSTSNPESYFNDGNHDYFKCLLAEVDVPGKIQKFDIYSKDILTLLEKYMEIDVSNLELKFDYQQSQEGLNYELLRINITNKLNNEIQNSNEQFDPLKSSLNTMNNLINSINISPMSLNDMTKQIEQLEATLEQTKKHLPKV